MEDKERDRIDEAFTELRKSKTESIGNYHISVTLDTTKALQALNELEVNVDRVLHKLETLESKSAVLSSSIVGNPNESIMPQLEAYSRSRGFSEEVANNIAKQVNANVAKNHLAGRRHG